MLTLLRNHMHNNPLIHPYLPFRSLTSSTPFDVSTLLRHMAFQFHTIYPGTFENFRVTGVQHMLGTTLDMFRVLHEYELRDAILCGKSYSTHLPSALRLKDLGYTYIPEKEQLALGAYETANQTTIQEMWNLYDAKQRHDPKKVLFCIDDGFEALKRVPARYFNGVKYKPEFVVGKEQTRGGSNGSSFKGMPFPIIHVAGSLAKKIESQGVARAIAEKSFEAFKNIKSSIDGVPTVGIIGYGNQGKVIAQKIINDHYPVIVFDANKDHYDDAVSDEQRMPNISLLLSNADIVISCTGVNITLDSNVLNNLLYLKKKRLVLISASSEDREFKTLLEHIQATTKQPGITPDPLKDIHFTTRGGTALTILRGGFPVNFDNNEHSVQPEEIWPTRAAIMGSFFMANALWKNRPLATFSTSVTMLCPVLQLMIVADYARLNPGSPFIHELFSTIERMKYLPENQQKSPTDLLLQHIISTSEGEFTPLPEITAPNGLFKVPENLRDWCKEMLLSHESQSSSYKR